MFIPRRKYQQKVPTKSLTAATTLTEADSGTVFFLNLAGGFTVTLPAPTDGVEFTFIVGTAPTTAYIIANHAGSTGDQIIGYPVASVAADQTGNGNAAGDQINFVANTALPSDKVYLISDGTSWFADINVKATGAVTITG